MAEADRRKRLALLSAEQQADAEATRVRITSESDKVAAKARGIIEREKAETLRIMKQAEADGEAARIKAENGRSEGAAALELEKVRLAAMPRIIGEMVKPAEKIKGISINHISGLGRSGSGAGERTSPMEQTVDSIMDLAVGLPAMKKIGDAVGVNLDGLIGEKKEGKGG